MLKASECSAPNASVNNYRGTERGFYFPYGQLYYFGNILLVAVWIHTEDSTPKVLRFQTVSSYISGANPEYAARGDEIINNGRCVYVLGQLGDLKDTGKRITAGT